MAGGAAVTAGMAVVALGVLVVGIARNRLSIVAATGRAALTAAGGGDCEDEAHGQLFGEHEAEAASNMKHLRREDGTYTPGSGRLSPDGHAAGVSGLGGLGTPLSAAGTECALALFFALHLFTCPIFFCQF